MNNRKVINNSCYNAFPSFSLLAQRKFASSEQKRTRSFFRARANFTDLQPTGSTTDIFYYHTNHLGSTAYVTDNNATITQGFLYAPFGEITT